MATETLALQVDVNTGKAVSNLGKLEKATKSVATTTKTAKKETITLEQQFKNLNKQIKEEPVNIRAMNKQIQEYQAIALQAGRTSPLGREAIQKAAAIKDKYVDIQNEVNRLANDGVKLKAALDLGSTVVAGFAGFQGIMALSGSKSEDLRKAMMKLQGAMALLMAVETIRKNLEKESTLVLVAKQTVEKAGLILTKATTAAQTMLGRSTDTTTKSFKLMRGALIATGIGALVVLIGTLIAQWDNITAALSSTTAEQKALNETMEAASKAAEEVYVEINKVETAFKLAEDGVISKEEALKTYNETIGQTLGEAESLEEAEQKFKDGTADYVKMAMLRAQSQELIKMAAEEQTKALLASTEDQRTWVDKTAGFMNDLVTGAIDYSTAGLTNLSEKSNEVNELFKKGREEEAIATANSQADIYLNLNKSIEEQMALIEAKDSYISESEKEQTKLEKQEADKREKDRKKRLADKKKQAEADEKAAEKKKSADEKAAAKQLQLDEKAAAAKKKAEEKAAANEIKREDKQWKLLQEVTSTKQELELFKLSEKYDKRFELAEGNAELEKALEEQKNIDLAAIDKKYADKEAAIAATKKAAEKAADDKEEEDAKEKRQQELDDMTAKLDSATAFLDSLQTLNNLAAGKSEAQQRKAFERNKKIQSAQAMISAAKGVVNIIGQESLLPQPIDGIYKGVQIAILAATLGLQLKKINSAKFGGGGSGVTTPSLSGGGGGSVPTLNPVSNTNTILGQDNKVYVTETDISNTQNKVKVIEEQATF